MACDGFRVQRLDHVHVFARDPRAAERWYADVLGLQNVFDYARQGDDPLGPIVLSSDDGATHLAVFQGEPKARRGGHDHDHMVAFRVDGAGFLAFLDRLPRVPVKDGDGKAVVREAVVDHGRSWSIYFCDLDGNPIELTTYDHAFIAARRGEGVR